MSNHSAGGRTAIMAAAVLALAACGPTHASTTTPATPATPASTLPPGPQSPTPPPSVPPYPSPSPAPAACSPALWQHVYHPARLRVLAACRTVTGIVDTIRAEADGDIHIDLRPGQPGLTNPVNTSRQHGDLVLEIICQDPVTQADAVAACHGYHGTVTVPAIGDHVTATGPWVLDTTHGWLELHPLDKLTVTRSSP